MPCKLSNVTSTSGFTGGFNGDAGIVYIAGCCRKAEREEEEEQQRQREEEENWFPAVDCCTGRLVFSLLIRCLLCCVVLFRALRFLPLFLFALSMCVVRLLHCGGVGIVRRSDTSTPARGECICSHTNIIFHKKRPNAYRNSGTSPIGCRQTLDKLASS